MKTISWNPEKNRELKSDAKRGICFEDIIAAIEGGGLLDDIEHPNGERYPGQRVLVVRANEYVYAVPYVQTPEGIFLKTVFPSRRLKAHYSPDESNEKDA
jgi:hypothetical protein